MKWSDISNTVGRLAPLVGGALGGPAGASVGGLVASALGVDATPYAISQAIKDDPEAAIKIKNLEIQNERHFRELTFKTLDVELADKKSAREAHKHNPMPSYICCALTLLVAAGAYLLFEIDIPDDNQEIAYLLFGTVLAKWGDSIAYWVGTTRSSAEKSRLTFKS